MSKIDFKRTDKRLYDAPRGRFAEIDVPEMRFVMVDGAGPPGPASETYARALEWLYSVSYPMKFAAKRALGRDYVVPPLEGLWWAEDPGAFTQAGRRDEWRWTMMIRAPDFVPQELYEQAVAGAAGKLCARPPESLRLENLLEGRSLQALHIGPYSEEGPLLAELHDGLMPARGVTFNGPHHEIYLSDARRTAPEKLRTILRQPVRDL